MPAHAPADAPQAVGRDAPAAEDFPSRGGVEGCDAGRARGHLCEKGWGPGGVDQDGGRGGGCFVAVLWGEGLLFFLLPSLFVLGLWVG